MGAFSDWYARQEEAAKDRRDAVTQVFEPNTELGEESDSMGEILGSALYTEEQLAQAPGMAEDQGYSQDTVSEIDDYTDTVRDLQVTTGTEGAFNDPDLSIEDMGSGTDVQNTARMVLNNLDKIIFGILIIGVLYLIRPVLTIISGLVN